MSGPAHYGRGSKRAKASDDPDGKNQAENHGRVHAGNLTQREADSGVEKRCEGLRRIAHEDKKMYREKKEGAPAWDPESPKVAFRRFGLGVAVGRHAENPIK
jgi:hypothetical protein